MNGRRNPILLATLFLGVALFAAPGLRADDKPPSDDLNIDIPAATSDSAAPAGTSGGTPGAPPVSVEATGPVDIQVPGDPVAKAAFDVLEKHCSRCHQEGKLVKRLKPAKDFGFILKLDQLAGDPHYIVPGNPDGSKIMQMVLNKEMPYDVNYEFDTTKPTVTDQDVLALRTWISGLGEAATASCQTRKFMTPVDMVTAMANDIETLEKTRVADTRYITLSHLYDACASDEEMKVYRQAVVKLLNSLSRVSDVVKLETVDEAGTIIRFNLKDLGWTPDDWNKILAVYPYGAKPDSQMFDLLSSSTVTPLPYVRGDWLAFTAAQPPLYNTLLGLADDFTGEQKALNIDIAGDVGRFTVRRAGFQQSGVSRNNRLIERHSISTGYLWTSYDFAGNRDRQSLFEFPLGPGTGDFQFQHNGGETIFSLPNHFQAYYLSKATGERLDKGPTNIVLDPSRRDQNVTNGISCMGCHDQGIRKAKDEVRASVLANRTFPKSARDAVEALYPTNAEMDAVLESDTTTFHDAMISAGLDPVLKLNGVEMINALSKRYENDVEEKLAAAEFGESEDDFKASLSGAGAGEVTRLGRRLDQGLVPRDGFETEFKDIVAQVSDLQMIDLSSLAAQKVEVAKVAPRPVADSRNFDLSLISDKSGYKQNDLPVFTVTSAQDCFLTLIDVDGKGVATVIFPNKFEQNNQLKANADFKFPVDDAPYQFRLADPGTETVVAVCSLTNKPVDSIHFDFTRDFTDLGDYTKHLTRSITVEAKAQTAAAKPGKPPEHGDIVARAAIKVPVQ